MSSHNNPRLFAASCLAVHPIGRIRFSLYRAQSFPLTERVEMGVSAVVQCFKREVSLHWL